MKRPRSFKRSRQNYDRVACVFGSLKLTQAPDLAITSILIPQWVENDC